MFLKNTVILIVDDSKTARMQLWTELNKLGFVNILEAENGKRGMVKILEAEASAAPVNLIISDWNMPEMSGLEFLREVRNTIHLSQLPFLMLSVNHELAEVIKVVNAGVSGYLLKPFTSASLLESLDAVWKRKKNKY